MTSPRDAGLWAAVAIGPLAWFADLVISFAVSPGPRRAPDAATLLAISGVAFVLAAAGTIVAWRELRATPRFLARAGVGLGALTMLLVLATVLPTLLLTPGGEP